MFFWYQLTWIVLNEGLLLDRIAVLRMSMWSIVTNWVAWSVDLSVSLSHWWASLKWLNRSRYLLGWGLGWAQGTMY